MDGAANKHQEQLNVNDSAAARASLNGARAVAARLIALDIDDAAEKLYAELLEEARNDAFGLLGDGDYAAPRVTKAWCRYLDRGADNYPWWGENESCDDAPLNAAGLAAYERFERAFEAAAELYPSFNAR